MAVAVAGNSGVIYYAFKAGDLNISGTWLFWAYVTFADSRSAPGDTIKVRVWDEGT